MRLFMAVPTEYAVRIVDEGFSGRPRVVYDPEKIEEFATLVEGTVIRQVDGRWVRCRGDEPTDLPLGPPFEGSVQEYVEFRDMSPVGLTPSRTTETDSHFDAESRTLNIRMSGGPMLADYLGDFIVSIEVPDDVARAYRVQEEPLSDAEAASWPFQEYWLPPEVANAHRASLVVFDSNDGEEVRPDLVGK